MLVLADCAVVVSRVSSHSKVSLTFVEYRGRQSGAALRLINGTGRTITPFERLLLGAGAPPLQSGCHDG